MDNLSRHSIHHTPHLLQAGRELNLGGGGGGEEERGEGEGEEDGNEREVGELGESVEVTRCVCVRSPLPPAHQMPQMRRLRTHLVGQDHLDAEQWVGCGLAVTVDGAREFLQRPLYVEPEGLLQHAVHPVHVGRPLAPHLPTVLAEHLREKGLNVKNDVYVRVYARTQCKSACVCACVCVCACMHACVCVRMCMFNW